MSLSQQEVRIATTVLETAVLTLPIVGVMLQYASQSRFAERPEFQGSDSYDSFILGVIATVATPLIIAAFSSVLFLTGHDSPLNQLNYLEISLIAIVSASVSVGTLIVGLYFLSRESDKIRGAHEKIAYQLMGVDELVEQVKQSDEIPIEDELDKSFRKYLMWVWREDPEVFEVMKEDFQENDQAELEDFSEDAK